MPTTVTSLEDRTNVLEVKIDSVKDEIHQLANDFTSFKSKIDTVVALIRWIGIFVTGLAATVVVSVISFAYSAGKVESNVDRLKEAVQQQENIYKHQDETIRRTELKMTEISTKLGNIEEKLKQKP